MSSSVITYPYPPTQRCEPPPEDPTREKLCRPLPVKQFPALPRVRPHPGKPTVTHTTPHTLTARFSWFARVAETTRNRGPSSSRRRAPGRISRFPNHGRARQHHSQPRRLYVLRRIFCTVRALTASQGPRTARRRRSRGRGVSHRGSYRPRARPRRRRLCGTRARHGSCMTGVGATAGTRPSRRRL